MSGSRGKGGATGIEKMIGTVKECKVCGEAKALSEFGKADGIDGARRDCKDCANAASKKSRGKGKGGSDDVRALVLGMVKGNVKVTTVVDGYVKLDVAGQALFRVAVGLDK